MSSFTRSTALRYKYRTFPYSSQHWCESVITLVEHVQQKTVCLSILHAVNVSLLQLVISCSRIAT